MCDLDKTGQASALEISILMCHVGCDAYEKFVADVGEKEKINATANLVSRVYRAMAEVDPSRHEPDQ